MSKVRHICYMESIISNFALTHFPILGVKLEILLNMKKCVLCELAF
jgi:hypothetical protein